MRGYFLILLLLTACQNEVPQESVRPVKAIQVRESSVLANQIGLPGSLRALKRADLSFRVDGMVILRDITVGHTAKKDSTLMQLDPREYEVALKKAQGKLESVQAQLSFAKKDYERMQAIFKRDPGAISESLLDRKKEGYRQLEAELTIAESDVEKATDDLAYTILTAPFDGIVAAIYVENHEQVRAKETVLRLLDTAEREMEIYVPEKFMSFVLKGKDDLKFEVMLDAFPQNVFSAVIKEIGTEASSTTQTYPITLSLKDVPLELSLLSGMSGKALLSQTTQTSSFNIPKAALFTENGKDIFVWVVDPTTQKIHKTAVTLDERSKDGETLIKEGLKPGDWVVTAGTSFLSEGQLVKLAPELPSQ